MALNPLLRGLPAIHPGAILEDVIVPGAGLDPAGFAEALELDLDVVTRLFAGEEPVTPDIAQRLGKWVSGDADFWLRLQANYDERIAAGYSVADRVGEQG